MHDSCYQLFAEFSKTIPAGSKIAEIGAFGTAPMDEHYERGGMNESNTKADEALFLIRNPKL